ncbi:MAG: tetratricopeptide repeat protein [Aestuariivirga sp.]|uniref:tetratricopeptide repeat protein n=1 Tax=Aestuariivirga sp. TaxID=2650926 RepID=UPI0038D1881B
MTGISLRAMIAGLVLASFPHAMALAYEQTEASSSGAYLAGRTAAKLRDNDLASDYLGNALKADRGNPVLTEKVFLLDLSEGDIAAAESLAGEIVQFNSQQRMARIVLGLKDFRSRHYDDARKHFQQAAYTPVGELTSWLLIAWSYAGEGDLSQALKTLDRLDSNESFANFKTFHTALIADYLGNSMRAEAAYRKAYEEAGMSLRIVQAYGNFLERNGRADEAKKVYSAFLENDENPLVLEAFENIASKVVPKPFIGSPPAGAAEALFSLASAMTDDESIDVALLYARLGLSLSGDQPVFDTLLGDIYEDMKRYDKAIAAYDKVPAGSPLRSNADLEIAVSLQRLERKDEAIARLKDLIAREPRNYDAIVTLGNLYRANEDFANAAKVYDDAIALIATPVPGHWRVFYFDGIAHERLKEWDIAEKRFRRSLELSPNESSVLNYLGYSMIEKKINLTEAMEMVKKAVALKPNDGYIIDSLGWAYYQLADYEQAVIHIERAVELLPADPIIAEHLGDAYWRVGRKLEAKFQWQHARDNDPEPEDLKRIEDKIINGLPDEPAVTPAQNGTEKTNG